MNVSMALISIVTICHRRQPGRKATSWSIRRRSSIRFAWLGRFIVRAVSTLFRHAILLTYCSSSEGSSDCSFGKKFIFDHHDICPELYEAKFGRRDFLYRLMVLFERWTFKTADISIATNESYRRIAIERGGMDPEQGARGAQWPQARSAPNPPS